ncbi:hypothetical protein [Nocardia phage P3.1]|nr:hypothetical protein [Nocardia phage P3.1]
MTTSINTNAITTANVKAADPLDADFTWYQEKAPSELHELHAALVSELTGVEVTAKQVQVILGMHGKIQASENNRKRAGYKPRTVDSIRRGGATTAAHAAELLAQAEAEAAAAAKAAELPSNDTYTVEKVGRKFQVVGTATGEVVVEPTTKKAALGHFENLSADLA